MVTKTRNVTKVIHSLKVGDTVIKSHEQITYHVVNHLKNLFDNIYILQDNSLVEDVIPKLVTDQTNNMLIMVPIETNYVMYRLTIEASGR